MRLLRYTLMADGPSDQALIPLLTWLLRQNGVSGPIASQWADLQRLPRPPKRLAARIQQSLELYPCDLLFVHRDAERDPLTHRVSEIQGAIEVARAQTSLPPIVCVVPVRMQEAWLLCDERALRRAAGNPNGSMVLDLPRIVDLENLPDPKDLLHRLLREASGLSGRRKKNVPVSAYAQRLADLIDDFSPLREVPSFRLLEAQVHQVVANNDW